MTELHRLTAALILIIEIFASTPGGTDAKHQSISSKLVSAARTLSQKRTEYDPRYIRLDYPMGDPGAEVGVCTDIVIRSYRAIGVDLQQLVHEDMVANFELYPARRFYNQKSADSNIDHRRVTNLVTFLERRGASLTRSLRKKHRSEWQPGDIVVFDLKGNNGFSHIGIISDRRDKRTGLPLVFHHLPPYPSEDEALSSIPISGHFRYFPE